MDTFAEAPVSINEIKAAKTRNAAMWTARDALVELLRRIDGGEPVEHLILAYTVRTGPEAAAVMVSYSVACPNKIVTLGLIERAKHLINEAN